MQFKVPQDVQRADRIVGPLTLRQLIICGIGFSICYAIFTGLGRDYQMITIFIAILPVIIVTVTFAFIKPLNLTFEKYILFQIERLILPSKRYWIKGTGDPSRLQYIPPNNKKKKAEKEKLKAEEKEEKKQKSINELTNILDKKV